MWTDTHCHLDAAEFAADRPAVLERARAAGVQGLVIPAVSAANFATVQALAHEAQLAYALGLHPLYVRPASLVDELARLETALVQAQDDPRLLAVGEIGLDFFVPGLDAEAQQQALLAQLKLAQRLKLPVLLHVRRSVDAVLAALRRTHFSHGGIAHAFNGSLQQARAFMALGFKLGFGGALTFERALNLRRLAAELPEDALVLETDAPDMPPQWRYQTAAQRAAGATSRNEPAELPRVAEHLSTLRGWTLAQCAEQTTRNAHAALPRLSAVCAHTRV